MKRILVTGYFIVGFSLLLSGTASAYIDPAMTAMLTQIIAGVFITLGVVFGVFRRKIILYFKNMKINRTKRKLEKQSEKQSGKPSAERSEEPGEESGEVPGEQPGDELSEESGERPGDEPSGEPGEQPGEKLSGDNDS